MRTRSATEVEILVIISPNSGEDPLKFRVAVYPWQLQDMRQHLSYAEEVFDAFRTVVCEAHRLNPKECFINVQLGTLFGGAEDELIPTGDVLSEALFLH